jgi:hypothetical protein
MTPQVLWDLPFVDWLTFAIACDDARARAKKG